MIRQEFPVASSSFLTGVLHPSAFRSRQHALGPAFQGQPAAGCVTVVQWTTRSVFIQGYLLLITGREPLHQEA
ncbi:g1044 [Coccomyxa viridis]|uniref:G1044 protein n=1 Tax=Coccomyxa viridis TaxID=1274662 RepID=A0ABP1FH40_9CHLO